MLAEQTTEQDGTRCEQFDNSTMAFNYKLCMTKSILIMPMFTTTCFQSFIYNEVDLVEHTAQKNYYKIK